MKRAAGCIGIALSLLAGCAHDLAGSRRTAVLQGGSPVRAETIEGKLAKYQVLGTPFVLRVRNTLTPIAVEICASPERSIFSQVRQGLSTSQVPCYRAGTALAPMSLGDDPRAMELLLSPGNGHNYYSARRRINERGQADIFVAGIRGALGERFSSGTVYAIVFVDDNSNRIIEEGEYELLELVIRD